MKEKSGVNLICLVIIGVGYFGKIYMKFVWILVDFEIVGVFDFMVEVCEFVCLEFGLFVFVDY